MNMKVNTYRVLSDAIERGIDGGWNRAHKHTDEPSEHQLKDELHHYIMLEICEYFNFDDDESVDMKIEPEEGS